MFGFAVMVLLFMVLPYTLLLLCGQCILLKSNWRIFCWINKSKVKAFSCVFVEFMIVHYLF